MLFLHLNLIEILLESLTKLQNSYHHSNIPYNNYKNYFIENNLKLLGFQKQVFHKWLNLIKKIKILGKQIRKLFKF